MLHAVWAVYKREYPLSGRSELQYGACVASIDRLKGRQSGIGRQATHPSIPPSPVPTYEQRWRGC